MITLDALVAALEAEAAHLQLGMAHADTAQARRADAAMLARTNQRLDQWREVRRLILLESEL